MGQASTTSDGWDLEDAAVGGRLLFSLGTTVRHVMGMGTACDREEVDRTFDGTKRPCPGAIKRGGAAAATAPTSNNSRSRTIMPPLNEERTVGFMV
mmetsp:Transcript_39192/g.81348  ORF Transcript_39192/g.81348 Transcript_39192/m.81348 type:complete len:96 (+) Transcript_39192:465-752(+)